jgi:hypothetical protein
MAYYVLLLLREESATGFGGARFVLVEWVGGDTAMGEVMELQDFSPILLSFLSKHISLSLVTQASHESMITRHALLHDIHHATSSGKRSRNSSRSSSISSDGSVVDLQAQIAADMAASGGSAQAHASASASYEMALRAIQESTSPLAGPSQLQMAKDTHRQKDSEGIITVEQVEAELRHSREADGAVRSLAAVSSAASSTAPRASPHVSAIPKSLPSSEIPTSSRINSSTSSRDSEYVSRQPAEPLQSPARKLARVEQPHVNFSQAQPLLNISAVRTVKSALKSSASASRSANTLMPSQQSAPNDVTPTTAIRRSVSFGDDS